MPQGINMTRGNVDRINRFLKVAVREGFDRAMQQHGDLVSLEEADVLKTMAPDHLRAVLEVSENVMGYRVDNDEDQA
jgi:hypothetical protein